MDGFNVQAWLMLVLETEWVHAVTFVLRLSYVDVSHSILLDTWEWQMYVSLLRQENLGNAKVSARQHCVYEGH